MTAMRGNQSERLEVETEKRSADVVDRVPEAWA
jgi:hypothetical protein